MKNKGAAICLASMGAVFIVVLLICVFEINRVTEERNCLEAQLVAEEASPPLDSSAWIYNKSSRIDLATAARIAQGIAKTKHPILIAALMQVESEFNPSVISSTGAIGLGQIQFDLKGKDLHGKTLISKGIIKTRRDLFGIEANIAATDYIISSMLKANEGNIVKTLTNYLGGRDGAYIHRVLVNYTELHLSTEGK